MTDIAELGFSVETRGIEKGIKALDALDATGKRVSSRMGAYGDDLTDVFKRTKYAADNTKLDKLIRETGSASSAMDKLSRSNNSASSSIDKTTRSGSGLTSVLGKLRGSVSVFDAMKTAIAGIGLISLAKNAVTMGQAFDASMNTVQSKLLITGDKMDALRNQAKELGAVTAFSASQAADGMGFLAQAGLNAEQIMAAMPATLNLASAANMDLAKSADIATNVMGAFKLGVEELPRITDLLALTSAKANTSVEELAQAIKQAGPIAQGFGVSIEETSAVLGQLANNGFKGEQAGMIFKNMLSNLANPVGETKKALAELNITQSDVFKTMADGSLQFKGTAELMDLLAESGASTTDMLRIFGQEAGPGLISLTGSSKVLEELEQNISKSGAAAEMAAINMQGLPGAIKTMASAWEAANIAFMDFIGTAASMTVIDTVTGLLRLATEHMQALTIAASALALVMARNIVAAAGSMALSMAAATVATVRQTLAATALATSQIAMGGSITGATGALLRQTGAVKVATIAGRGLGVVMALLGGPVGLFALAALGVYAYRDEINEAVTHTGQLNKVTRETSRIVKDAEQSVYDYADATLEQRKQIRGATEDKLALADATLKAAKADVLAAQEKLKAAQRYDSITSDDDLSGSSSMVDGRMRELESKTAIFDEQAKRIDALNDSLANMTRTTAGLEQVNRKAADSTIEITIAQGNNREQLDKLNQSASTGTTLKQKLTEAEKAHNELMKQGASLTQNLLTPQEEYQQSLAEAEKLLKAGAIDQDIYNRALTDAEGKLTKATAAKTTANTATVKLTDAQKTAAKATESLKTEQEKANQALEQAGKTLTNSVMNPLEKYNTEIKAAEKLLDSGKITQETYNRVLVDQKEKLNDATGATKAAKEAQEAHNKIMSEGKSVFESTRTDAEKLTAETKRLKEIHEAGGIQADTYQRAIESVREQYDPAAKAAKVFTEETEKLSDEIEILEAKLYGNEDAARAAELRQKGLNKSQIDGVITLEKYRNGVKETTTEVDNLGKAAGGIADSLANADWSGALDKVKSFFIQPLKDNLSSAIKEALSGGENGGILGGIKNSIGGLFKSGGALSGVGSWASGIGTALSGVGTSVGTAISGAISGLSGGLAGIGSSLAGVAAAMGPVGWAVAGVTALIAGFAGQSDPELTFTQGFKDGQGKLGQGGHLGQGHNRESALGGFGATDASNKIGRAEGFVPEFHKMMDAMVAMDALIAGTLPDHIDGITEALKGVEMSGFSTSDMLEKRYSTVIQALPDVLERAMLGGKKLVDLSADEIIAKFAMLAEISNSQLIPSMELIGFNLGDTNDKALAAAVGLADAAGGLAQLQTGLESYYAVVFTKLERQELEKATAQAALDVFNAANNAHITSLESFKSHVEGLDKQTAAGQEATAAALELTSSIATLYGTAEEAAQAAAGQAAAQAAATQATQDAILAQQAAVDAQRVADAKKEVASLAAQGNQDALAQAERNAAEAAKKAGSEIAIQATNTDALTDSVKVATDAIINVGAAYESAMQTERDRAYEIAHGTDALKQRKLIESGWTQQMVDNLYALKSANTAAQNAAEAATNSSDDLSAAFDNVGNAANNAVYDVSALKNSISSLVAQLYSPVVLGEAEIQSAQAQLTNLQNQYSAEQDRVAGLKEAAQSAYSAEVERINGLNSAANDAYNADLDRVRDLNAANDEAYRAQLAQHESLKNAAYDLRGFIDDFRGTMDTGDAVDNLHELQKQFNAAANLAASGDLDAAQEVQGLAGSLRGLYSEVFGSGTATAQLADNQILVKLESVANALDAAAGNQPIEPTVINDPSRPTDISLPTRPADIESTVLASLQSQIAAQQNLIASLSAANETAETEANRQALALELATRIGELGLALDESVFDLLRENGIAIADLAADFGVDVTALRQSVESIGTSITGSIASQTDSSALIPYLSAIESANDTGELRTAVYDLLSSNGQALTDLKAAFNVDISQLNADTISNFDTLADALHIDTLTLSTLLGADFDDLKTSISGNLSALPNLSNDIRMGLAPYLSDIETANDTGALQTALASLQTHVDSLPPGIQAQLNNQLDGIVGNTSGTISAVSLMNSENVTALNSLASALQTDTVSLASELGADLDVLGNQIASYFAAQTTALPSDIQAGLAPYLSAIETSNDTTTLQLAIAALQGRVDLLPPAIRDPLNATLAGIVGNTDGITDNITDLIASNQSAISSLANSFGVDVGILQSATEQSSADNLAALANLSTDLSTDFISLASTLGADFDTLGDSIAANLATMPNIPDDIKSGLAPFLNAITNANDDSALRSALGAIEFAVNGAPASIRSQLSSQLNGIISSNNPTTTVNAVNALRSYINSLPTDIKSKLNAQLSGILSSTSSTKTATDAVKAQAQLINGSVSGLPPGIKSQLNTQLQGIVGNTGNLSSVKSNTLNTKNAVDQFKSETQSKHWNKFEPYYQALRTDSYQMKVNWQSWWPRWVTYYQALRTDSDRIMKNLRSQNANWPAKSAAIPSYRVGTDALKTDGLIMAHKSETIFSPSQSLSLREKSLAALSVLPEIGRLLSASNEPEFNQNITIAPQKVSGGNNDEVVKELRAIKSELTEAKRELKELKDNQKRTQANIESGISTIAETVEDWDGNGVPVGVAA